MGLSDYKINSFSKPVSALDDTPQMSAAELKEWFDSNSANELKNSVNGIIDELKDVDLKQHAHDNKDILDNITEEPIYNAPSDGKLYARKDGMWSEFDEGILSISSDELDTFVDGVCRVKGDVYFDGESFDKDSIYIIESENYALCIAHCRYEGDRWDYYQTLIFGDGKTYTRYKNDHIPWDEITETFGDKVYGEWSEWKRVKPLEAYRADRATEAHKDYNGNVITDTYATKEELDSVESALDGILETQYNMMYVTFYVDTVAYTAPKGITWGEFINSSYNDGTFSASDYENCVYVDGYYVYYGEHAVRLTNEIQQNASYGLSSYEDTGEQ